MRDVDARFLLANERTLLAWTRTALTLQAGGIGLLQFGTGLAARAVVGVLLLLLGAAAGIAGHRRYRRADEAMRAGRLPAKGHGPELVSLAATAIGAALAVAYIVAELD